MFNGGSDEKHYRVVELDGKPVKIGGVSIKSKASPGSAARKLLTSIAHEKGLHKMNKLKMKKVKFSIQEYTQGSKHKVYGPYVGHFHEYTKEELKKAKTAKGKQSFKMKPIVKLAVHNKHKGGLSTEVRLGKNMCGCTDEYMSDSQKSACSLIQRNISDCGSLEGVVKSSQSIEVLQRSIAEAIKKIPKSNYRSISERKNQLSKLEKYDAELVHHEYISILLYLIINLKEYNSLGKVSTVLTKLTTDHYKKDLITSKSYLISLDSLFDITDENKIGTIDNIKNNIIQFLNNNEVKYPANINKEEFKFYLEAMLFYSHKKYYFNYTKFKQGSTNNTKSAAAKKVFFYIYKKSIDMIRKKKDELQEIEKIHKIQKKEEKQKKMQEINELIPIIEKTKKESENKLNNIIKGINVMNTSKNDVSGVVKNLIKNANKISSEKKRGLCKDIRRLRKKSFKKSDHNLERRNNKHPLYSLEENACSKRGIFSGKYTDEELENSNKIDPSFTKNIKKYYKNKIEEEVENKGKINIINTLRENIIEKQKMIAKYKNEKKKIEEYQN